MHPEANIEVHNFKFSGISATTPDPDYVDDLINVEVNFSGEIEYFEGVPIVCLNQVRRDVPEQTILLESKDLYLTLGNFGKLIFTGFELYTVLFKQYVDVAAMDPDHKQETIQNCNRVIEQFQNYVASLEKSYEAN
jgi:hypothetical protein